MLVRTIDKDTMITFASDFFTSKTTWACLLGLLTAVSGYMTGTLDGHAAVAAAMYCLIKAFERDTKGKMIDEINVLVHLGLDKLKSEEDAKADGTSSE